MKAAQIDEYGDVDVIKVREVEKPSPGPGQVLVKVWASSINPFDSTVLHGRAQKMMTLKLPVTLGGDIAGVIEAVGDGVTTFGAGDKVYGQAYAAGGDGGAFAEYTVTAATKIAQAPGGLSFDEIAALPLTGVSALQGIVTHLDVKAGQKVLIHGGSGGIGTIAIQLAKHLGAYVATTVPAEAISYVRGLGADVVIDYKTEQFEKLLDDYDAVFDLVGGDVLERSYEVVKKGGMLVSMVGPVDQERPKRYGITVMAQGTRVTTAALDELRRLVEDGVVKAHVDQVFELNHIASAFAAREHGGMHGKVVVRIAKS